MGKGSKSQKVNQKHVLQHIFEQYAQCKKSCAKTVNFKC